MGRNGRGLSPPRSPWRTASAPSTPTRRPPSPQPFRPPGAAQSFDALQSPSPRESVRVRLKFFPTPRAEDVLPTRSAQPAVQEHAPARCEKVARSLGRYFKDASRRRESETSSSPWDDSHAERISDLPADTVPRHLRSLHWDDPSGICQSRSSAQIHLEAIPQLRDLRSSCLGNILEEDGPQPPDRRYSGLDNFIDEAGPQPRDPRLFSLGNIFEEAGRDSPTQQWEDVPEDAFEAVEAESAGVAGSSQSHGPKRKQTAPKQSGPTFKAQESSAPGTKRIDRARLARTQSAPGDVGRKPPPAGDVGRQQPSVPTQVGQHLLSPSDVGLQQFAAPGAVGRRQPAAPKDMGRQPPAVGGVGPCQPATPKDMGRQLLAPGGAGPYQPSAPSDVRRRQPAAPGEVGTRQQSAAGDVGQRQPLRARSKQAESQASSIPSSSSRARVPSGEQGKAKILSEEQGRARTPSEEQRCASPVTPKSKYSMVDSGAWATALPSRPSPSGDTPQQEGSQFGRQSNFGPPLGTSAQSEASTTAGHSPISTHFEGTPDGTAKWPAPTPSPPPKSNAVGAKPRASTALPSARKRYSTPAGDGDPTQEAPATFPTTPTPPPPARQPRSDVSSRSSLHRSSSLRDAATGAASKKPSLRNTTEVAASFPAPPPPPPPRQPRTILPSKSSLQRSNTHGGAAGGAAAKQPPLYAMAEADPETGQPASGNDDVGGANPYGQRVAAVDIGGGLHPSVQRNGKNGNGDGAHFSLQRAGSGGIDGSSHPSWQRGDNADMEGRFRRPESLDQAAAVAVPKAKAKVVKSSPRVRPCRPGRFEMNFDHNDIEKWAARRFNRKEPVKLLPAKNCQRVPATLAKKKHAAGAKAGHTKAQGLRADDTTGKPRFNFDDVAAEDTDGFDVHLRRKELDGYDAHLRGKDNDGMDVHLRSPAFGTACGREHDVCFDPENNRLHRLLHCSSTMVLMDHDDSDSRRCYEEVQCAVLSGARATGDGLGGGGLSAFPDRVKMRQDRTTNVLGKHAAERASACGPHCGCASCDPNQMHAAGANTQALTLGRMPIFERHAEFFDVDADDMLLPSTSRSVSVPPRRLFEDVHENTDATNRQLGQECARKFIPHTARATPSDEHIVGRFHEAADCSRRTAARPSTSSSKSTAMQRCLHWEL